jgi:hypothetical protein
VHIILCVIFVVLYKSHSALFGCVSTIRLFVLLNMSVLCMLVRKLCDVNFGKICNLSILCDKISPDKPDAFGKICPF